MSYTSGSNSDLIVQLKTQLEKNPQYLKLRKDDHRFASMMKQCFSTDDLLRLLINIDDFRDNEEINQTLAFVEMETLWALRAYTFVNHDLSDEIQKLNMYVEADLAAAMKSVIKEKIQIFYADLAYCQEKITAYANNFNLNVKIPNQKIEQLGNELISKMDSYLSKGFFKVKKENLFWNQLINDVMKINSEPKLINFLIKVMEINYFQLVSSKTAKKINSVLQLMLDHFSNWLGYYRLQNLFSQLNKQDGMALMLASEFISKLKLVKVRTNSYTKIQAAMPDANMPMEAGIINKPDGSAPEAADISNNDVIEEHNSAPTIAPSR